MKYYCYKWIKEGEILTALYSKINSIKASQELIKEVPNEDFANQVICKKCGTEFIRE